MHKNKLLTIFVSVMMLVSMLVPTKAFAFTDNFGVKESITAPTTTSTIKSGNRVYFYNMSGGKATLSDFIIIESNGHWGLIDSGHRKASTISDGSKTYSSSQDGGLSSQIAYKNGVDAAKYMVETLGVKHLDFIIGTHAHSDHLGGIPEIANLLVTDPKTKSKYSLVSNDTAYIYKPYNPVNTTQDDISGWTSYSWHNQAYSYQAISVMKSHNAKMVDVSNYTFVQGNTEPTLDYTSVTNKLNSISGISGAQYKMGAYNNFYDDTLSFKFGNMNITLYNLFMHNTNIDENVNSIVATITYNGNKVVSLADINVEDRAEQQITAAIRNNIGTADVLKAAHHGVCRGSNSKEMIDNTQPKKVIATRGITNVNGTQAAGAYANAMKYAKSKYGTVFYENGASGYGLVVDLSTKGAPIYNLTGKGKNAKLINSNSCVSNMRYANGWSNWDKKWSWNNGQVTDREIYYFQDNAYKTGWYKWNGKWYFLNSKGIMATGWQKISGKWYYFDNTETSDNYGEMKTGWLKVDNKWYYLDSNGVMQTGWKTLSGKTYYLKSDGSMAVYTNVINGNTYYFNGSGAMHKGWLRFNSNGKWRYYNSNGVMQKGWQKINNKWYLMAYADGYMVTGWYTNSNGSYYLQEDGSMAVGYCTPNTHLNGTANVENETYYFMSDGSLWIK